MMSFVIWPHRDQQLEEFHCHLNGLNSSIKFTIEKETEGRIAFPDVQLEKKGTKVTSLRTHTQTDTSTLTPTTQPESREASSSV